MRKSVEIIEERWPVLTGDQKDAEISRLSSDLSDARTVLVRATQTAKFMSELYDSLALKYEALKNRTL
jgi:hypothetical protein